MLKPQLLHSQPSTLCLLPKPSIQIQSNGRASFPIHVSRSMLTKRHTNVGVGYKPAGDFKAIFSGTQQSTKVKATITVKKCVFDLLGRLNLELVSAELDPNTGSENPTVKGVGAPQLFQLDKYEAEFEVPQDFGEIGAIFVETEYRKEMYLQDIVLDGIATGPIHLTCNSWIHSKRKGVFFTNKSYLPSQTPKGLTRLREEELASLRGNGQGEREKGERIYDYDVYNDLGNPDQDPDLARPVLGGKDHPYPRRCRTGRPRTKADSNSESRSISRYVYVPRDEEFSEIKQVSFNVNILRSALYALIPVLQAAIIDRDSFPNFTAIDSLFNEGISLPLLQDPGFWKDLLLTHCSGNESTYLIKVVDGINSVLRFNVPEPMERDRFFWLRDEEFARETLSGLNPCSIKLVTEWPLKSELELVEEEIREFQTFEQAIEEQKLFILDYHDLLLPFVSKVRELKGTTLYGSRTLFYLTPNCTLTPIAIELTRPPMDGKPQWKQVFKPTDVWLWRLAKAHVLAHDSGYHQLISHWLRTHCCTEPYVIAAHRQLSAMHPIYRLLQPHFRYTMEINALARQALINAGGIIETSFFPGKYSMEISSVIYDKLWRFDNEALPKDLINRGMAIEDRSAPHGLKLTVEDYPYANDGLDIWDAVKQWVSDYVNHYYPDPSNIVSDNELQAWWTEVRTVGHGDKKDEPWWPKLETPQDLIQILTTIIWIASAHHAAVNFGQYPYGGYFPNRPTIARINMPTEDHDDEVLKQFREKPEEILLKMFPSQIQATKVMATLDVLSTHSPEEEYLGQEIEPAWSEEPYINAAFEKFKGRLKELEGIIDERNADKSLRNRNGAGIVPYELLQPSSGPGVTGRGVPSSISI